MYYQNPFIYWFNHYPEPGYRGPRVELADGALVVGGGLASLDVVKILMLETVVRALANRGDEEDLYDLERRGIGAVLAERRLTLADLGLRGCMLIYRRGVEDMPVANPPEDATPEQTERTRATRRKLLHKFSEKYLFGVRERRMPVGYLTDGERLGGLRLAATAVREGRAVPLEGTVEDVPSRLVISSVGSIPEPLEDIPMHGEVFRIKDARTGKLEGLDGVFAVGNAVTGKGNITDSQRHGRVVSRHMLETYLQGVASGYEEVLADAEAEAGARAAAVAAYVTGRAPLPGERVASILERVRDLHAGWAIPGTTTNTWPGGRGHERPSTPRRREGIGYVSVHGSGWLKSRGFCVSDNRNASLLRLSDPREPRENNQVPTRERSLPRNSLGRGAP